MKEFAQEVKWRFVGRKDKRLGCWTPYEKAALAMAVLLLPFEIPVGDLLVVARIRP